MLLLKTLHFKLCVQSALSFGKSSINYKMGFRNASGIKR